MLLSFDPFPSYIPHMTEILLKSHIPRGQANKCKHPKELNAHTNVKIMSFVFALPKSIKPRRETLMFKH